MDRRNFVKTATAASLLASLPRYSMAMAKGSDKIKVGLIGCGSRGTGAITNMMDADQNIQLIAIADLFENRIKGSIAKIENFAKKYADKKLYDLPADRQFTGFDAYKKLLSIPEIDVVILATTPVFRPLHIEEALKQNKHIFAEKPICIDPVGARKITNELVPLANEKKLCVVCGTQTRYYSAYAEAISRVHDGQIGEIVAAQSIRYAGKYLTGWYPDEADLLSPENIEFQLKNWLSFIWTSGDQHVEQNIHNLDVLLWALKDIEPDYVVASGGRCPNLEFGKKGNRFSNMSVNYDFKGVPVNSICRQEDKTAGFVGEKIIGTKGTLNLSFNGPKTIVGEKPWTANESDKFAQAVVEEHRFLLDHVRNGNHINTMSTMVNSCLIAIAGRESAYSGMRFKYGWIKEKSILNYLPNPEALAFGTTKAIDPIPVQGEYLLT